MDERYAAVGNKVMLLCLIGNPRQTVNWFGTRVRVESVRLSQTDWPRCKI